MVPFFLVLILCRQKLLITGAGEGPIIWGAQPLRVAEWRWVNAGGWEASLLEQEQVEERSSSTFLKEGGDPKVLGGLQVRRVT